MSEPAVAEPETVSRPRLLPPYHVLIENDDDHSQLFVILVLRKVFGYDEPKAMSLMHTAEQAGEPRTSSHLRATATQAGILLRLGRCTPRRDALVYSTSWRPNGLTYRTAPAPCGERFRMDPSGRHRT